MASVPWTEKAVGCKTSQTFEPKFQHIVIMHSECCVTKAQVYILQAVSLFLSWAKEAKQQNASRRSDSFDICRMYNMGKALKYGQTFCLPLGRSRVTLFPFPSLGTFYSLWFGDLTSEDLWIRADCRLMGNLNWISIKNSSLQEHF